MATFSWRGKGSRGVGFRPRGEHLEDRFFLSGLPVANIFAVTNAADSGAGSLRQALIDAGNNPAPSGQVDLIQFNIGGSGTQVINLASALPVISSSLTIDGTSQPGYAGTPLIEIDGAGAGASVNGLDIAAADCTIEGLSIVGFSGNGINFDASTVGGDLVAGDYVGLTPAGAALPNAVGINVDVSDVTIGGTTSTACNIISGNNGDGVLINGGTGDIIEGNYIGTSPAGNTSVANGAAGIDLENASGVTIGGTAAGAGNVISGNILQGILLANNQTGDVIEGNRIGTDLTGTLSLSNGGDGITLENSAGNTIGGTSVAARNIISGNGKLIRNSAGVNISGNSSGNLIEGNYIGVDATDQIGIENHGSGIVVNGSSGEMIGGTAAGAGNVITGNAGDGVSIVGSSAVANIVQGNFIGTTPGLAILGNEFHGVYVANGANNNQIGGTASGAGNVIDFNGGDGVLIGNDPTVAGSTPAGVGNAVEGNSIYGNAQIGIDLGPDDGPTPNNSTGHTGPNDFENFPVLTASVGQNGPATVTGTLASTPNTMFRIELFSTDSPDPTGYGQAETFVGAVSVTTDASGNASFTANVNLPQGQDYVTATATDPSGNTSEFSLTIASAATSTPPGLTSLSVNMAAEGSESFVLAANGSGFVSGATIDWIGTALDTTFVSSSQLQATVPAADLAEEGTASITVVAPQGTSGSLTFTITDPSVVATGGATVTAVEGTDSGNQAVATFTDPGGVESLADYSAVVNWNDGAKSIGTISESNGIFTVSSDHTFAEEGTYPLFVTITHDDSPPVTVTSSAIVSDPAVAATGGFTMTAVESSDSGSQTVATFTDPGGAEAVGDYSATIDWGDGSAATVGSISLANGTFTVSGDHTYSEEGTFAVTVTVAHEGALTAVAVSSATVSDPAVAVTGGLTVTTVEGSDSGSQTVATFTDPGGAEAVGDYSATIDWGDGSTATVGSISFANGTFTVSGDHTYSEEGTFAVTVTVAHEGAPAAVVGSSATVSDPAVAATGGVTVTAVEGSDSGSQTVATFTDPGGAEAVGDYSATIEWGDGSAATVGSISFANDTFTVSGDHTYSSSGTFAVTVSVTHESAPVVTAISSAVVSPTIVVKATGGFLVHDVEGQVSGSQTVATFKASGGVTNPSLFSAIIAWGDGNSSVGSVSFAGGVFTVTGSHTYAEEGRYTIGTTISIAETTLAAATSHANVSDPAVVATGGFTVTAVEASDSSTQTVATFTDPGGAEAVGDYSATIHWGDGSSSAGTISFAGGVFTVVGDHTYSREGQFKIRVIIAHENAPHVIAVSSAIVADAPWSVGPISGPTMPQPVHSLVQLSALLYDPGGPGDRHRAVWSWGDGTTSSGTITEPGTDGDGLVSGSHRYRAAGVYTVTLTVRDNGGGVRTATLQLVVGSPAAAVVATTTASTTPAGAKPLTPLAAHHAVFHALGVATSQSWSMMLN
jgi:hypothetical protein